MNIKKSIGFSVLIILMFFQYSCKTDYILSRIDKHRLVTELEFTRSYNNQIDSLMYIAYREAIAPFNVNYFDTIVINNKNIIKKCRSLGGTKNGRVSESYLVDINTGNELHGLYKIIYNNRKHKIGIYYYGHPFVPIQSFYVLTQMEEYYRNNKYLYSNRFTENIYEEKIRRKGLIVTFTTYAWDLDVKVSKRYYWITKNKLLPLYEREYKKIDKCYRKRHIENRYYDPCEIIAFKKGEE